MLTGLKWIPTDLVTHGYNLELLRSPVMGDEFDFALVDIINAINGENPLEGYRSLWGGEPSLGDHTELAWLLEGIKILNSDRILFGSGNYPATRMEHITALIVCNILSRINGVPTPYIIKGTCNSDFVEIRKVFQSPYKSGQVRLPRRELVKEFVRLHHIEKSKEDSLGPFNPFAIEILKPVGLSSPNSLGVCDAVSNCGYWLEREEITSEEKIKMTNTLCIDYPHNTRGSGVRLSLSAKGCICNYEGKNIQFKVIVNAAESLRTGLYMVKVDKRFY